MRFFPCAQTGWLVVLALCAGVATAQAPLTSELVVQRVVVDARGQEAREGAAAVKPGELIQYTATYTNRSRAPLAQFSATLPIPAGTVFVVDSGQPLGAQASVDGKSFDTMPLRRKVQQPDGRWVETPVPLADYRALRWPARTLGAKERFVASLRVRVSDQAPAAAVNNEPRKP